MELVISQHEPLDALEKHLIKTLFETENNICIYYDIEKESICFYIDNSKLENKKLEPSL